jgi:hypothetical protein
MCIESIGTVGFCTLNQSQFEFWCGLVSFVVIVKIEKPAALAFKP